ncbi:MAG: DUF3298 domain-containing protein [Oscillospiraceae bacterium]|jgi:hypothetical protein|nr:DUF3298 domain-containing protein [Oscillospiraceae bacterium]
MKNIRKQFAVFALAAALSAGAAAPVASAAPVVDTGESIAISVNGVQLTDAPPAFESSDVIYLPLRALAETVGFEVGYDEATRTAELSDGDRDIALSLTSGAVSVNGAASGEADFILRGNRTFVTVDFVSEYISSGSLFVNSRESDTETSAAAIYIYMPLDVSIGGGIRVGSLTYGYDEDIDGAHAVSSSYAAPVLHGFGDADFEETLNKSFSDAFDANEKDILDESTAAGEAIADGRDDEVYSYASENDYTVTADDGILTISENGYLYSGGAHAMYWLSTYVIDIEGSKRLSLEDLFESGTDYKTALIDEMNAIRAAGGEYWEDVSEIGLEEIDAYGGYNFYFADGTLVIYYNPYDVAAYAVGMVKFEIPSDSISGIVAPEYSELFS